MPLQQLYDQIASQEWIDIPTGWQQGRTIYGGVVAGMLMHKAWITLENKDKHILNANITFVGPVEFAAVKLTAEILRQGKFVTTLEVRLWQNDQVQSILVASFGLSRESTLKVQQLPTLPEYKDPENLKKIAYYEGFTPEFYKQFELTWAEGYYPYAGKERIDFGGWFRFSPQQHSDRQMTVADFLVMLDIWPAGMHTQLKAPVPTSTLTWNITFLMPLENNIHDWLKYKMHTDYADDGYLRESEYIWDITGRLVAISRQTLTIFA